MVIFARASFALSGSVIIWAYFDMLLIAVVKVRAVIPSLVLKNYKIFALRACDLA